MLARTALAVIAALALPATADGALDARLSITPTWPRAGQVVTLVVHPYWPYTRSNGTCCRLVPADVDYPFRIQLLTRSASMVVRPQRTADRYVWSARARFPNPGVWRVRLANYYYDQKCKRIGCAYDGPQLVVRVR